MMFRRVIRGCWLGLTLALAFWAAATAAHEVDRLRVDAGIDLFPSCVAADLDVADKVGSDGALFLLLVYQEGRAEAERLAEALGKLPMIRGLPVRVGIANVASLDQYGDQPLAGIFVVNHVAEESLAAILEFGRQVGALVVSPHEGDVEEGASGGIRVSDRILPYVNMSALGAGGVRLKPFFLRISDKYED